MHSRIGWFIAVVGVLLVVAAYLFVSAR